MKIKTFSFSFLGALILVLLCGISCKSGDNTAQKTVQTQTIDPETFVGDESRLMLAYLNELGDYVNSRSFPSLIRASSVYENLGTKQLILDIRVPVQYAKGHIKGAINIDFSALPEYFESEIVPFEYDKIILVSESGQTSSYATCLLRLMGYGNVYSMRWGMSAWNNDFAKEYWFREIGSDYEAKLDTKIYEKASPHELPQLNTGKTTGEEVLLSRVKKLFAEGLAPMQTTANKVFDSYSDYYIMNYIRRDKYEDGHIPGSIRYKPQGTLGIVSEMATIPTNKVSIVYCGTGHNSGFVTAYLRLFGYNAQTLMYGNNGFMYDKMVKERDTLSWLPFTSEEVNNYPYVKPKGIL